MRRVLMVSPHFPPDTSAGTHRVRLLAPHLPRYGWEPTVVTVDRRDYEGRLDPGLAELVPNSLRVVRCRAWSPRWTRKVGFGDLGLRALSGLYRTCVELLRRESFDVLFVTIYPAYPALLGPCLKRRFGIPVVLDYQDPWVGEWGKRVGGGPQGAPDWKSRVSRALAALLEAHVVRHADALTAVSAATYEQVRARYPNLRDTPCLELPIGGEPRDFEQARAHPRANPFFDPADGAFHLCYVGTLLPMGLETLRALLRAVVLLRERQPAAYGRLRLHFFGTSNQTDPGAPARVLPVARELGVAEAITETAARIDYLSALTVLTDASGILLLGSSERHYTASKLYPALLAKRPILAVYHEASTVSEVLRQTARPSAARLVTYSDAQRAESRTEAICDALASLLSAAHDDPAGVEIARFATFSAETLAGTLARLLDTVALGQSRHDTINHPTKPCDDCQHS
ncbi:MAG TPA: glycosyltransferase [Candidatus Acidoferrales bacterium]|nr:glycosyltransferase [Candidatus Acidoferrales bacterium]